MTSPHSNSNASSAFDLLAEPVRRWIWDQGWTELRDIQEHAILGLLKADQDLIIAAPTAGGKTEAAFLPLISSVLTTPGQGGFDLVYVAPLRALINDQTRRMEDLCERAQLPVYPWHGDISQDVKARARRDPRGVLLITPESLEALFVLRGLEIPTLFAGTRTIIIDELHALLDNERGIHLRSLLTRLERAVRRRIQRVGLSATLTEMDAVKEYLRPEDPESVHLLESKGDGQELRVQLRAYRTGEVEVGDASKREVAKHLFSRLRGTPNLVFAGSRVNVEWYADALREMSERANVPLDFFPHHASLSRAHRLDVERRLKTSRTATAICTSTLELGIDIGDIDCVAQIGPPFSVSSLRQRLGRSGRRGQPAVLRMYAIEKGTNADSHPIDRLHLDLVRSIAMVELLIERWYEPPAPQALHLSTLTHQILSVIAEHGGAAANRIYETLCRQGPFRKVTTGQFARLLRQIGSAEVLLIEQAPDGTLLLGSQGEKLVEHYSFYAVFQTAEEYRVLSGSNQIGVLPVSNMVFLPDMTIILSGRRWRIIAVHSRDKVIEVTQDPTGTPPPFGGSNGLVHDRVTEKMRAVFSSKGLPAYLDNTAARLLEDARSEFFRMGLDRRSICETGDRERLVSTWAGTIKTTTLSLKLKSSGFKVVNHDGFLEIEAPFSGQCVEATLHTIAKQTPDEMAAESLPGLENVATEKFHRHLSPDLLYEDVCSSLVDLRALPQLARNIVGHSV